MGIVFDIQRCCYHDGPGIRTTVFLKGCQLRCEWCHNPESFTMKPQLQFNDSLCIGCQRCAAVCPLHLHHFDYGQHQVDFKSCISCGKCVDFCPVNALEIVGHEMSAAEVMAVVRRDLSFYQLSGGGLTVSGGEPTFQYEFLTEILTSAKAENINTCVETNGYIPDKILQQLIPLTDLWLLDYKITDKQALNTYTGAIGTLWDSTVNTLNHAGSQAILRMPIIPGINDTDEHFTAAAKLLSENHCISHAEIMAYHAIGAAKWQRLGYDYALSGLPSATPTQKAQWEEQLRQAIAAMHS